MNWKLLLGIIFNVLWLTQWLLAVVPHNARRCTEAKYVGTFAALFGMAYLFVSLLGFPKVGPFVILIKEVIVNDLVRTVKVSIF